MAIFLPILYLMGGLALGKIYPSTRDPLSRILAKQLISFVIICSLATYQPGTGTITLIGLLFCLLMFTVGKLIWRDRLTPLLISYLNVGWLGSLRFWMITQVVSSSRPMSATPYSAMSPPCWPCKRIDGGHGNPVLRSI